MLEKIMSERREDVRSAREHLPKEELLAQAKGRKYHSLRDALRSSKGPCIVAEMKKASPSAGVLRTDYRPADIAKCFRDGGASAISILTEPRHFMGSGQDLCEVRKAVDLPLLRKDFICDEYQVCEAAAWGADIVLLIVAALDKVLLRDLFRAARDLNLDVLVEAHSADEVGLALNMEDAIVGVNSRDLKTLRTDLSVAVKLSSLIPADRLSVAESGIRSRDDIAMLRDAGYRGFLVGETLMKHKDPGAKLRDLLVANSGTRF
jgi:indole-3-glycerol phosphate synthase